MTKNSLPLLASRIFNTPLLIEEQKAQTIVRVLGPRIGADGFAEVEIEALQTQFGAERQRRDDLHKLTPEGIAVISVEGPLMNKAGWFEAMSGGPTSYESIDDALVMALRDPAVRGVILDLDSPGGETKGAFELGEKILSLRGNKPIWAVANGDAFSAAYMIASAADRVFVTPTGGVGSIGVYAMHVDQSEAEKKAGLKVTEFKAGAKKNEFSPHKPISDEGAATLQTEIDRLHAMFVGHVSEARGLSEEHVRGTEAGLYFGPDGVDAGLADGVSTFEGVLSTMTDQISETVQAGTVTSAAADLPASGGAAEEVAPVEETVAPVEEKEAETTPAPEAATEKPNKFEQLTPARSNKEYLEVTALAETLGFSPTEAVKMLTEGGKSVEEIRAHIADHLAAKDAAQDPEPTISSDGGTEQSVAVRIAEEIAAEHEEQTMRQLEAAQGR